MSTPTADTHKKNQPLSIQKSYSGLLQMQKMDTVGNLANIVMNARVMVETAPKRKPKLSWDKKKEKCIVLWSLLAANFAIVQFTFKDSEGVEKTIISEPARSSPDERSSKDSTTHAERYALGEAINEALRQGWKPKGIKNPQALDLPPTEEQFMQYKEALKNASIVLFSEREPCKREHGTFPKGVKTCTELFSNILTGENHHLYHAVDWTETQKNTFDKEVKEARQVYYVDRKYQHQEDYINQHPEDVRKLREKYQEHRQEHSLVLKKQPPEEISSKEKLSRGSLEKFKSRKLITEDDQLGVVQEEKKRKAQNSEKNPKKQKTGSLVPEINQEMLVKFKDVQEAYSSREELEQTVPPLLSQFKKEPREQMSELKHPIEQAKIKKKKKKKSKDFFKRK